MEVWFAPLDEPGGKVVPEASTFSSAGNADDSNFYTNLYESELPAATTKKMVDVLLLCNFCSCIVKIYKCNCTIIFIYCNCQNRILFSYSEFGNLVLQWILSSNHFTLIGKSVQSMVLWSSVSP